MALQLKERHVVFNPSRLTFGLGIAYEFWRDDETNKEKRVWKYILPDVAQVMAMTPEGKIIGIREFQPGVGTDYMHLIGETLEDGEDPVEAAKRGLLEETGYVANQAILVSTVLQDSGRSDRLIHFVLLRKCSKMGEGEKEINVELFDPAEFWDTMMNYFLTNPEKKHAGGNSLKLMTLAFYKLGLIKLKGGKEIAET